MWRTWTAESSSLPKTIELGQPLRAALSHAQQDTPPAAEFSPYRSSEPKDVPMPSRRVTTILLALIGYVAAGSGQPVDDIWRAFRSILGQWEGEASAFGSVSDVTHHWGFAVNGKFLRHQTPSIARAEGGDVHQDGGYLSHDDERAWFVVRQYCRESAPCPGESRSSTRSTASTVEPYPPPARYAMRCRPAGTTMCRRAVAI